MSVDRLTLKSAAAALLDSLATEHPLGHQASKARRYILQAPGGTPLKIMFEQDEGSSANLWVHAATAGTLASRGTPKPASDLWAKTGKAGPLYGRHSSLRPMPQLGDADLICFTPTKLAELGEILDQLIAASAARIIP